MIYSLLFFSPRKQLYRVGVGVGGLQGVHEVGARPRGGAPHPREKGVGPLVFIFGKDFFIVFSKMFRGVSGHSENICFLHIKQHHGNSAENSVIPG